MFAKFKFVSALSVLIVSGSAPAAHFAAGVTAYTPGTGPEVGTYPNASSAVGAPSPLTGQMIGFPNILNPFSPAYEANELVAIGMNGSITIDMGTNIQVVGGGVRELGVITNLGLEDVGFPNGQNGNPATTFNTLPREASVGVSATGIAGSFVSLGTIRFDRPANYFVNATDPYAMSAPANPLLANFGQQFDAPLSAFNGLNFQQTLGVLGNSGGGTWIDADAAAGTISQFRFINFSIPAGGFPGTNNQLFIDAVVANNATIVPEPAIGAALAFACLVIRRGRR